MFCRPFSCCCSYYRPCPCCCPCFLSLLPPLPVLLLEGSRIMFVNGEIDPWHANSVLSPPNNQEPTLWVKVAGCVCAWLSVCGFCGY